MLNVAGTCKPLASRKREARLSAYVDEAIRQALRDQPTELPNDSTVLYHRSYPIGSALADIFAHRAAGADGPSLFFLLEKLLGTSLPHETPDHQARRGILCGLCNEIATLLYLGGKGGFSFNLHDEGRMLMNGVRKGRSGDAGIVRAMTETDDSDSSRGDAVEDSLEEDA